MRPLSHLDRFRDTLWEQRLTGQEGTGDDLAGCFRLTSPYKAGVALGIIAAVGDGWDHVSVSPNVNRTPTWLEMEYVKRLFFKEDEVAMQLHVPPKDHVNTHEYVLHLWRPHHDDIPLPPSYMV